MKYLKRLKTEKCRGDALPKLPKGSNQPDQVTAKTAKRAFDSNDSALTGHFLENTNPGVDVSLRGNEPEPDWHRNFCAACADLNNWRECCPLSVDDCLLSRIMDAENVEQLKGHTIGQGVKTDDVIQLWDGTIDELFNKPLWFICVAESIARGKGHGQVAA